MRDRIAHADGDYRTQQSNIETPDSPPSRRWTVACFAERNARLTPRVSHVRHANLPSGAAGRKVRRRPRVFSEGLDVASKHLLNLGRATLSGEVFDDDAATGQGLLNRCLSPQSAFFLREAQVLAPAGQVAPHGAGEHPAPAGGRPDRG